MTELNTLVRLPRDFDIDSLVTGKTYSINRPRERSFPLHIAMLLVDDEFNYLGYCSAEELIVKDGASNITFRLISLFSEDEKKIYNRRYQEAIAITKEFEK